MDTFYVISIACDRRGIDAERLKDYLVANGMKRTPAPEEADFIFLVTCGLPDFETVNLKTIKELGRHKGKLVLCGCMPAMQEEKIRAIFNGPILHNRALPEVEKLFPEFKVRFREIPEPNRVISPTETPLGNFYKRGLAALARINLAQPLNLLCNKGYKRVWSDPRLFMLRISEGCLGNCSFCAIRKAIGRLESKRLDIVRKKAAEAVKSKQFLINIISSDAGSYGMDIGTSLPVLLKAVLDIDERLIIEFIQDLHPVYVCKYKDELIALIKTGRIKTALIPVQSGSERILKLMNRPLDVPKFKRAVAQIRAAYPGIRLRTQIIVGFPTETEEDFQATCRLVKECRFEDVNIFEYYEYPGTPVTLMEPKIPAETIGCRAAIARRLFVKKCYCLTFDGIVYKIGTFIVRHSPALYRELSKAWRVIYFR